MQWSIRCPTQGHTLEAFADWIHDERMRLFHCLQHHWLLALPHPSPKSIWKRSGQTYVYVMLRMQWVPHTYAQISMILNSIGICDTTFRQKFSMHVYYENSQHQQMYPAAALIRRSAFLMFDLLFFVFLWMTLIVLKLFQYRFIWHLFFLLVWYQASIFYAENIERKKHMKL